MYYCESIKAVILKIKSDFFWTILEHNTEVVMFDLFVCPSLTFGAD